MADGVAITAGSGTTVATDDTGAPGHVQLVKLAIATDGSATLIPADGTDGLLVNLGANNDVTITSGTVTTVTAVTAITNALPVGANVIGGVTIASGATSIAKAEDVASADADVGVPAMAVRKATPANTSGTDGDYEMLQISAGRLWASATIDAAIPAGTNAIGKLAANSGVDIGDVDVTSLPALATGSNVIGGVTIAAGATNIAKAEDDASANLDVGVPAMAVRKASPANTSGTDGDYEMLQISAGRLWASATIDAAIPAGTNAIGKLAANSGVDIGDIDVTSIAAGDNNIGNVDIVTVPTDPFGANGDAASSSGSISAKLRFIAATGIPVTGTVTVGSHAVTNAGTFAVQVDGNALTSLQLIDDTIKVDDAGFTVATDKVSMAGYVAVAHSANPDAADANDAVAALTNRHRVQFVIGGHPNTVTVKHTTITTAVTDAAVVTIAGGLKIVVTAFTFTLDNASTVFPTVLMGFGASTTPTTTGVLAAHGGVPAGGGFSRGDGSGILGIGADGEDLRITTTGNATGNGLQLVVSYYTIES